MCCPFLVLIFFGPRLAAIVWWLMRPSYFSLVFNGWLWPVLGIIFLPWTTLSYAAVSLNGITTFEWFILIFAFLVDLGAYSGGIYQRRNSN